jgi:hypothetical protein
MQMIHPKTAVKQGDGSWKRSGPSGKNRARFARQLIATTDSSLRSE